MSRELRTCPVRGSSTLIVPGRLELPHMPERPRRPGGEGKRLHSAEGVEVVPNGLPLFAVEARSPEEGLGANEVILEPPGSWSDPAHVERVLAAVQARVEDLRGDVRLRWFTWFKERGLERLERPHSQLLALPGPDPAAAREAPLGDLLEREQRDGRRVIHVDADHLVLCPWAPRGDFEAWVLPRHPTSLPRLALPLADLVRRLDALLGSPALLIAWRPGRIEVLPRLHLPRGAELVTGYATVAVGPERAAAALREA